MTGEQAASAPRDDAELVARARRGDGSAFDCLFQLHYPAVYRFALHLLGTDRDAAEDVAQTAFVRAYDALPRLHDGQAFVKYLYRTALNVVRDGAKRARRKPWVAFAELWARPDTAGDAGEPVEFADRALDPETLAVRDACGAALQAQIAALPLDLREVLVLHHLQEMDVRQVAQIAGVPEGTVKSRLNRARRRLRAALADWVDVDGAAPAAGSREGSE